MRNVAARILIALAAVALATAFQASTSHADSVPRIETLVWQLNKDYPDGTPVDSSLPIQTVYIKTHDGTDWMSTYDSHPAAVSGPAAIQNLIGIYASQGIQTAAWFVPKGTDYDTQVAMAEQVIDSGVTALYADLEPFAGFCNQNCVTLATNFWARVRQERPNARLGVIYDPRPWWWDSSATTQWFASADVAMPMCYWDDYAGQIPFGDPAGCITQAKSDLAQLSPGRSLDYLPLLQGDSTPDRVRQSLDAAVRTDAVAVALWRRGVVSGDTWNMIAGYQAPSGPHCAEQLVDGCLVKEAFLPQVYLIQGGAKFPFPSDDAFAAMGFDQRDVQVLPQGQVGAVPNVPIDGILLQEFGSQTVYVVYGGAKFVVPPADAQATTVPRVVPPGGISQIPSVPQDYTRFREESSNDSFVVLRGGRIQLTPEGETALADLGHGDSTVHVIPDGGLSQVPVLQVKRGDVDCDGEVGVLDAVRVIQSDAAVGGASLCMHFAGDVTCDGQAMTNDALLILSFFAESPGPAAADCPAIGEPEPALLPTPSPTPSPGPTVTILPATPTPTLPPE
jgi:hypothetical protein